MPQFILNFQMLTIKLRAYVEQFIEGNSTKYSYLHFEMINKSNEICLNKKN